MIIDKHQYNVGFVSLSTVNTKKKVKENNKRGSLKSTY